LSTSKKVGNNALEGDWGALPLSKTKSFKVGGGLGRWARRWVKRKGQGGCADYGGWGTNMLYHR